MVAALHGRAVTEVCTKFISQGAREVTGDNDTISPETEEDNDLRQMQMLLRMGGIHWLYLYIMK